MKIIRRIILWILIIFFGGSVLLTLAYKVMPVEVTPLMLIRHFQDDLPIHHKWVPIKQISPDLAQAVVASEDNRFMTHNGFDKQAIEQAIEEAQNGKRQRGVSTISQQTAKNASSHSWLKPARRHGTTNGSMCTLRSSRKPIAT